MNSNSLEENFSQFAESIPKQNINVTGANTATSHVTPGVNILMLKLYVDITPYRCFQY